jgi:hypothetical protein
MTADGVRVTSVVKTYSPRWAASRTNTRRSGTRPAPDLYECPVPSRVSTRRLPPPYHPTSKGHDSGALRDGVEAAWRVPVIPHRGNRVKPSRIDGRRLRRYKRRWTVERTNACLHRYRGLAVRRSLYSFLYTGLVSLVFTHVVLQRF